MATVLCLSLGLLLHREIFLFLLTPGGASQITISRTRKQIKRPRKFIHAHVHRRKTLYTFLISSKITGCPIELAFYGWD